MPNDDSSPNRVAAERDWAGLDRNEPTSDVYGDFSPDGILLCRSCHALARCRLGIHRETLQDDGSLRSEVSCPGDQEGGPQVAHGGWTAAVLDELSGHTLLARDEFAVTGELLIKFVKPIPIERELIGTFTIIGRDGRRVSVAGELRLADADAVLAVSHAVMVRRPKDHFERHQLWLGSLKPDS